MRIDMAIVGGPEVQSARCSLPRRLSVDIIEARRPTPPHWRIGVWNMVPCFRF
jgi:hypothetical protein